ncbi:MAG: EamA family transporter [Pseudolabrys sp.]
MNQRQAITADLALRVPPQAWFVVSAVFHYLGPAFAALLFAQVGVLGVAWFRIASAAVVFALWIKPWRLLRVASRETLILLVLLGGCLAVMNSSFYLAIARLPLSLVATIEFLGVLVLALAGLRTARNYSAVALAAAGVLLQTQLHWSSDPLGLAFAGVNALLFMGYIVLGHRIARTGAADGVERLGAAMVIAFIAIMPIGLSEALPALRNPLLVLAGVGVGICSSVIPYVCDQLAMARLPRNSFALMLALLPATATIIGAIVLKQVPGVHELAGVGLVMAGIILHRPSG